jgi:hypothetical protein
MRKPTYCRKVILVDVVKAEEKQKKINAVDDDDDEDVGGDENYDDIDEHDDFLLILKIMISNKSMKASWWKILFRTKRFRKGMRVMMRKQGL